MRKFYYGDHCHYAYFDGNNNIFYLPSKKHHFVYYCYYCYHYYFYYRLIDGVQVGNSEAFGNGCFSVHCMDHSREMQLASAEIHRVNKPI